MADLHPDDAANRPPVTPEELTSAQPRVALRGFDQLEVKALLNLAADRVRALTAEVEALRGRLSDAEQRAVDLSEMDEAALTAALGDETARVLREARAAATDMKVTAESKAADILKAAEARANELTTEAQGVLDRERTAADAAAREIIDKAKAAGRAELDRARRDGKALLDDAAAFRAKTLGDLARKRIEAEQHLEALEAARARLVLDLDAVRQSADAAARRLDESEDVAALEGPPPVDADEATWQSDLSRAQSAIGRPDDEPSVPSVAVGDPPDVVDTASDPAPVTEPTQPVDAVVDEVEEAPAAEPAVAPAIVIDDLAPDPVAPGPAPEPAVAETAPGREGRRSSALRILRADTPKPKPKPAPPPRKEPEVEDRSFDADVTLHRVAPSDGIEGVRLLDSGSEMPVSPGPEPTTSVPPTDPEPDTDEVAAAAEPVQDVDEPATEPEPTDEEPTDESAVDEATAAAPAHEPEAEEEADGTADSDADAEGVEAIFARIRADREDAAEWAQGVLASDGGPSAGADGQDVPADGEAEPLAEPSAEPATAAALRRPPVFEQCDRVVEERAPDVARRLRRALADEQNDVLAAVRSHRGWPTVGDLLPGAGEHGDRYVVAVTEALAELAGAGAAAVDGSPPVGGAGLAAALAEGLCTPLRQRLERTLADARTDLADHSGRFDDRELADRVSAVYREWRRRRIDDLAAAHARAAFASGAFGGLEPGSKVAWTIDPEHGPCSPDCEDNALAGAVEKGTELPSGAVRAPAFDGCRCLVLPADG